LSARRARHRRSRFRASISAPAPAPWIYPYIGGGAGYAWTNFNRTTVFTPAAFPALGSHFDQTQGGFAFQAIGGLSFPMPRVPGLSLTTEYRFFGKPYSETFDGSQSVSGLAAPVPIALKAQSQYNHSFMLGVRYAFNVAAPVPVAPPAQAAPAPAPARSYLVFFDWDKATLSDRARQIIKEAADNSTRVQYTRIEVNGYTDTSGNDRVHLRLGQATWHDAQDQASWPSSRRRRLPTQPHRLQSGSHPKARTNLKRRRQNTTRPGGAAFQLSTPALSDSDPTPAPRGNIASFSVFQQTASLTVS